ncbi:MAG: hypothetical protein GXY15_00805 [Candidatus Hydrogenedentes bacterium]|nr:hypothetical protein [Candidatus Hydrogenedentota bacterium]
MKHGLEAHTTAVPALDTLLEMPRLTLKLLQPICPSLRQRVPFGQPPPFRLYHNYHPGH